MASFVLCVFRCVKDDHNLLYFSPFLKKTFVSQVVLDKWFPLNEYEYNRDVVITIIIITIIIIVIIIISSSSTICHNYYHHYYHYYHYILSLLLLLSLSLLLLSFSATGRPPALDDACSGAALS